MGSANSSYYKVYEELWKLPECRELVARARNWLSDSRVHRRAFEIRLEPTSGSRTEARAAPFWWATFGPARTAQEALESPFQLFRVASGGSGSGIPLKQVLDTDFCSDLVERSFGTRVKTWGCKKQVALEGLRRSRHDWIQDFRDWARDRISTDLQRELEEAAERLQRQAAEDAASEEFREARHQALVDGAAKTIGEALRSFAHLGDEVLRDAVRAYVVDDIMER